MFSPRSLPRLLHLGLLAFAVALLAVMLVQRASSLLATSRAAEEAERPTANATVIDVARGVDVGMLTSIVQIGQDERIVAIDDQPIENDLAAGAAIARKTLGANTYLDLTVASPHGKRRVLVLMH
jgi:hypothetical protein